MNTKTSILTALVALASGTAAMAQVYSQNVVGYVNVTVPTGFSLVANPLVAGTNTVASLIPAPPEGTVLYKFNEGTGQYIINSFDFGEWAIPAQTLLPGEGAFVKNGAAPFTVTFVGEVKQGALSNAIPAGFSVRASQVPQSGQLDTVLQFPVAEGDVVYTFNNATSQYRIHSYDFGEWSLIPVLGVGESFFVKKAAATSWNRTFSVN